MKLNGNAVKPGNVIEHNGRLWTAVKVAHVKPGKGGAFAQIELRDIRDGTKLNERFRSSETVERVILDEAACTFLYDEGDHLVFAGLEVGTFVYRGNAAFTGGSNNSEARFDSATGKLLVDTDGDGVANLTLTLTGMASASDISGSDFIWS